MDRYLWLMLTGEPRRFRVIENIIRNKRTQANLFWGLNYHLLNWLGSDLRLTSQEFNQWLVYQHQRGLLNIDSNFGWLTSQGEELKKTLAQTLYQPHNSQWSWLINSYKFADRFLLAVQAASELVHHHRNYVPLNISGTEMIIVRKWLTHLTNPMMIETELQELGQNLAKQDKRLAIGFAKRLLGYQTVGWTTIQAQQELDLSEEEVRILNWDIWLGVASQLKMQPQTNLGRLMEDLIAKAPISNSAFQTLEDFRQGQTMEQIAHQRQLKISTVREHLLEAAIIVPRMLDWQRLLPIKQEQQIRHHYHGPVATWRFKRTGSDPATDFFTFRLCQIKEFQENDGAI
ncbi:helix-turn-helix domain-containing protein [uncultured Limosilactobacillus sp.]|uniref:helix-turn-helix domain-containing protein n=1 Tax=uncultured Limosilactobacillus sp. TaxID=2837629 RepID=UPI0025F67459|nr:helix-turn-helix domain-containing protein [uncultured Limosilactobacillus sp.]